MPSSKKKDAEVEAEKTAQDANLDAARETARINHENEMKRNEAHSANEGVEVREAKPVEVINPVVNPATGELEDDTRTLKQTPEEQVGAEELKTGTDAPEDDK